MKQESNQNVTKNWSQPKIVLIVFLVFIMVLIGQFTYLSLSDKVYGDDLKAFANNRITAYKELIAKRGTVFDKEGNVLAINVTSYTLIAYLEPSRTTNSSKPNHVVDIEGTAKALSEVLNAPYEYILSRLQKEGVYQVEFGQYGSRLTELNKLAIEELELPGLSFIESSKRFYPNGSFASYSIGYAKTDKDGTIIGEMGIEKNYENILKGTNGSLKYQKDLTGYQIPDTPFERKEPVNGKDIYLTIDSNIQRFLETAVKETVAKHNPEWMIMVIMDARTGEILGSATSPSFDPNNLPDEMTYQNPLISYTYEPGSVMKTFTYLCALETGKYDGSEMYMSGSYKFTAATVRDWNTKGWGRISFDQGYLYSSNVGAINVAKKYLTPNEHRDCLAKLGFGSPTGIELSGEGKGNINFNGNIEIDWLSVTYGQGMTMTAVQILQALSVIANDGYMVKPHIVSKIVDNVTGEVIEVPTTKSDQLFSKESTTKMRQLMEDAVNKEGSTARTYRLEDITVLGKTGTAQIAEGGKYLTGFGNYLISFSGLFPGENPEYVIYAAMSKPNTNYSGNLSAPVKDVIKNIAKYRNIYNDNKNSDITTHQLVNYINQNVDEVKATLETANLKVVVIGDGNTVINQYPYKGTTVITGDKIFLVTNGKDKTMENVVGWARNDFETYMKLLGVSYTINGYGYVTEQSVNKGTIIDETVHMEVTLKNKYNIDERDE